VDFAKKTIFHCLKTTQDMINTTHRAAENDEKSQFTDNHLPKNTDGASLTLHKKCRALFPFRSVPCTSRSLQLSPGKEMRETDSHK
jgi:hypothetical protein